MMCFHDVKTAEATATTSLRRDATAAATSTSADICCSQKTWKPIENQKNFQVKIQDAVTHVDVQLHVKELFKSSEKPQKYRNTIWIHTD